MRSVDRGALVPAGGKPVVSRRPRGPQGRPPRRARLAGRDSSSSSSSSSARNPSSSSRPRPRRSARADSAEKKATPKSEKGVNGSSVASASRKDVREIVGSFEAANPNATLDPSTTVTAGLASVWLAAISVYLYVTPIYDAVTPENSPLAIGAVGATVALLFLAIRALAEQNFRTIAAGYGIKVAKEPGAAAASQQAIMFSIFLSATIYLFVFLFLATQTLPALFGTGVWSLVFSSTGAAGAVFGVSKLRIL